MYDYIARKRVYREKNPEGKLMYYNSDVYGDCCICKQTIGITKGLYKTYALSNGHEVIMHEKCFYSARDALRDFKIESFEVLLLYLDTKELIFIPPPPMPTVEHGKIVIPDKETVLKNTYNGKEE